MAVLPVVLAACVLAGPPSAELGQAVRHYQDFHFAQAIPELEDVARRGDAHERAQAFLYLGLVAAADGDEGEARRRFGQALALEDVAAPPGTSPQIIELLEDARRKAGPRARHADLTPHAPQAMLVVETEKPRSRKLVWISGGAGAAALVTAALLGWRARVDEAAVNAHVGQSNPSAAVWDGRTQSLADRAGAEATGANVAFGVAAVGAIAAGVSWWLTR